MRSFVLILLACLIPCTALGQQTGRIVGRVSAGESGAPIADAQVFLPGTGLGSLTRQNGTYVILEAPAGPHEVRVERIGMAPVTKQVTVPAGQAVELNFQMTTQALGLDEIVVTGTAGAARRREVGSTISQINVAELSQRPTQVANLLQAAAPGILVTSPGAGVGDGYQIRLRGNHSIAMSNQPIVYIDGVRMQSNEFPGRFTVGGADGPAGTSGSGGNIKPNPLGDVNPNDIERIEVIKGSAATTLYGTEASAGVIQVFTKRGASNAAVWNLEGKEQAAWLRKFGNDAWPYLGFEPYVHTGLLGDYSVSVRGGGQALQYFGSGGYQRAVGQLPQDTLSKWMGRGNFTFTPTEQLQLQLSEAYSNQNQRNTPAGGNQSGIFHSVFRRRGNAFASDDPTVVGQLWRQEYRQQIERYTTGATGTYSPIANVTTRFTVGYDQTLSEIRGLRPVGFVLFTPGSIFNDTFENRVITFDYVGTYSFGLLKGLRSSFSWGGQAVGEDNRRLYLYGENFPGNAFPTVTSGAVKVGDETRSKVWNAGFFFQNVLDVDNRYFLTFGARVDGNSAFGSGFGLQVYPKASASWVLSDESFWHPGWGSIKVRAAYGQSGRAPGAFDAVRTWTSQVWSGGPSLVPLSLGNPDLGPEVTAELETGFDGEWLGGRLTGTLTYFSQTTTDALFNVTLIQTNGFQGTQRENVGKLSNTGLEVQVSASPIQRERWGWDLGVNLTTNHSKVVSLGGIAPFASGGGWIQEGYPAPVYRGKYITNPDAIADPIIENNHIYGPTAPTLTVAPSTTVRLPAGISLTAQGEFRGGMWMKDGISSQHVTRGGWVAVCWPYYANPYDGASNNYAGPAPGQTTGLKPDTPALWRATCNATISSPDFETTKGDYFRLRTLTAQIPVDFVFPERVSSAAVTLSLNNSWSWYNSAWRYNDPDTNASGLIIGAGNTLPVPITFVGSLRLQF